jgi:hypothetical protein
MSDFDTEFNKFKSFVAIGDIENASSYARISFHLIYDHVLSGGIIQEEVKSIIVDTFDKATRMECSAESLPYLESIKEKAYWIRVLFEQGSVAVHSLIRKKIHDNALPN